MQDSTGQGGSGAMVSTGMDIAQVRGLATQMQTAATQLVGLGSTLTGQLERTVWQGPDREAFKSQWSDMETGLKKVSALLDGASKKLNSQAQQQEEASKG